VVVVDAAVTSAPSVLGEGTVSTVSTSLGEGSAVITATLGEATSTVSKAPGEGTDTFVSVEGTGISISGTTADDSVSGSIMGEGSGLGSTSFSKTRGDSILAPGV